MNGRTTFALAVAITSALATGATTTAYAWDTDDVVTSRWSGYEPATLDYREPVNAEVLAKYVDARLDKVEAFAAALSARVGTMRLDEAKAWLAKVRYARTALGQVETATFAQRVAALDATLASLQARLVARIAALREAAAEAARLAAERRAAAVAAAKAARAEKVLGTRLSRDGHRCDGWDRDGWDGWDRDGWDGDGDRDGWWDGR